MTTSADGTSFVGQQTIFAVTGSVETVTLGINQITTLYPFQIIGKWRLRAQVLGPDGFPNYVDYSSGKITVGGFTSTTAL